MLTKQEEIFPYGYPGQIAVITSAWEGRKNMMAAGWYTFLSMSPPLFGVAIAEERYSYSLIRKAGAFAVHFLPAEHLEWIEMAGRSSGEKIDKFERMTLPTLSGIKGVPILLFSHVAYECLLKEVLPLGDHHLFVGEVVAAYKDQERFTEDGFPDWEKLTLPLYLGKEVKRNRDRYLLLDRGLREVEIQIPDGHYSSGSSAL